MTVYLLSRPGLAALPILLSALLVPAVAAQPADAVPDELKGIRIEERLEAQIPLDLEFVDESGRTVKLSQFYRDGRPVILTLNYYRCPMLCGLQLNGLISALKEIDWTPGEQFEILTVSFDPLEEPRLARQKKRSYINEYGRPGAASGWHFLTGKRDSIKALTETVGFNYRWNEKQQQWAHSAALIICTPAGRVSRYLGGIMYEPKTVRLSLIEASAGKIGSFWDQAFLWCYHYDAGAGRYAPAAMGIMRIGGGLTLAVLVVMLIAYWRRERRRRKATART